MKDRIIFWLDADVTHFGIAKFLLDKYDCDLFAIIDITDKPKKFFQQQQLINFKKIWFYHDYIIKTNKKPDLEYLASFERKYGINLWLITYNERIFYLYNEYHKFSTDEILTILEQECKLFESVLDEIKPDFMVMRATDLHQNHLFYELCKARNIKVLLLGQSRFAYRSIVSSLWHQIDKPYDSDVKGPNKTWDELLNYLKGIDTFKQTTDYTAKFQSSKFGKLSAVYKFLTSKNSNEKNHYTYYGRTKLRVLTKSIMFVLRKRYRQWWLNRHLVRKIEDNTPFIYFPMHLDQESTLLIGAPFFTNQSEVVTHIVKSMPVGYKVYVKEHPAQSLRGWRKISFYKQILDLPNVELIHPSVKPEDIVKRCSLVLSIASTAGLEAAFYQKPSIILADAPYKHLLSVYRLGSIEDLPNAIRTSLHKTVDLTDVNKYVNFVNENSFQCDIFGIELGYAKHFYHDGHLVDVEITSPQMESFLNMYKEQFEQLALEHIKKITQYKET